MNPACFKHFSDAIYNFVSINLKQSSSESANHADLIHSKTGEGSGAQVL